MSDEGPDVREAPVDPAAVRALLSLLEAQQEGLTDVVLPLLDLDACARNMRRFKLDVSVDLMQDGHPRCSLNDTGEPEEFRRRLLRHGPALGFGEEPLRAFLSLLEPGRAQTTAALKWSAPEPRPRRVSLYYEELMDVAEAEELRAGVFALSGTPCGPPLPAPLAAACVDLEGGAIVAVKDYWTCEGEPPIPLPPPLARQLASLAPHPRHRGKRYMVARRFGPDGSVRGYKVLWITEATRPRYAAWAWQELGRLHARLELSATRASEALDRLVRSWPHEDCYIYPDLICLNARSDGAVDSLLAYVSVK